MIAQEGDWYYSHSPLGEDFATLFWENLETGEEGHARGVVRCRSVKQLVWKGRWYRMKAKLGDAALYRDRGH